MTPGERVWDEAAGLGAEIDAAYWSEVVIHGRDLKKDELARAVRRLLDRGRPGTALDAACTAKAAMPGPLLTELLDALAGWLKTKDAGGVSLRSWEVETVFAALDLDRRRRARLLDRAPEQAWRDEPRHGGRRRPRTRAGSEVSSLG